jgi:hypothetical protein
LPPLRGVGAFSKRQDKDPLYYYLRTISTRTPKIDIPLIHTADEEKLRKEKESIMFWKNRYSVEHDNNENETKTPYRRIFGFQCSSAIHITAKTLAKQLHVDLFAIAEHAMQFGLMDIAAAMKDP